MQHTAGTRPGRALPAVVARALRAARSRRGSGWCRPDVTSVRRRQMRAPGVGGQAHHLRRTHQRALDMRRAAARARRSAVDTHRLARVVDIRLVPDPHCRTHPPAAHLRARTSSSRSPHSRLRAVAGAGAAGAARAVRKADGTAGAAGAAAAVRPADERAAAARTVRPPDEAAAVGAARLPAASGDRSCRSPNTTPSPSSLARPLLRARALASRRRTHSAVRRREGPSYS